LDDEFSVLLVAAMTLLVNFTVSGVIGYHGKTSNVNLGKKPSVA
jgi:uncharacterized membrane protein (UPF0136 family)